MFGCIVINYGNSQSADTNLSADFIFSRSSSAKAHLFVPSYQLHNNKDLNLFDANEVVEEMTFFLQVLRVLAFQISSSKAAHQDSDSTIQLILVRTRQKGLL